VTIQTVLGRETIGSTLTTGLLTQPEKKKKQDEGSASVAPSCGGKKGALGLAEGGRGLSIDRGY